ncbi:MAG TPA: hypothetical protein DCP90_08055 [Clostridiales bacterium]|nr:MAG: hypothetical protein A2Y22_00175 [Clostridiales bacterium GWD2_32_59]HAN10545.1 hypothetical protein [Clostridiales bacterium]
MRLNKFTSVGVVVAVLFINMISNAYALETYYKKEYNTKILNGVDYQRDIYLTDKGWLNAHILKVDYNKKYIDIVPVYSKDTYGKRDTLTNLMKGGDYIAGINADFFDMRSNVSYQIGTLVENGKLLSTSNINEGCNNYATIFLSKENPFIDFFDVNMKFYANDNLIFNIKHLNKITNFDVPVLIDNRELMKDTSKIDTQYKGLYKIVIEDGIITKFSEKGEVVDVPENGYILVMKEKTIFSKNSLLAIGQKADFDINTSINVDKVEYSVSGSVKILEDGQVVNRGVPNTGRHPRTAIGITKDDKVIMLAIDGRSDESVGVTHEELATIMLNYGAYNAMNFDGGGSTTMALKSSEGTLSVVNKVSDGTQRKIINGLAVVNNSKVADAKEIKIKTDGTIFAPNEEIKLSVSGFDEFGNVSNPDMKKIKWTYVGVKGKINGEKFIAETIGKCKLTATYGTAKADIELEISDAIDSIKFDKDKIILENTKTEKLVLKAFSNTGQDVPIDMKKVKWVVSSKVLGTIKNGEFKAGTKYTKGYITATYKSNVAVIPVISGIKKTVTNDFNKMNDKTTFVSFPETVKGALANNSKRAKGGKSFELKYTFEKSDVTQAAYISFSEPIEIKEKVQAIGVDLYGDKSNNIFKAKIIDASNKEYAVTLSEKINWSGYKYISINLDESMVYPIKLERLYVASLKKDRKAASTVYVDNIYSVKLDTINDIKLPTTIENMTIIENDAKENATDIIVLDGFDSYTTEKQSDIIKNINTSYELVLTTDASENIKNTARKNKIQNQNINYKVTNKGFEVIYLNSENGDMYRFLENSLLKTGPQNVVIVTNQIDLEKNNNKQTILKSIINEASEIKKVLVISNKFKEENVSDTLKYLPINLEKVIKIKIKDNDMKYGYIAN